MKKVVLPSGKTIEVVYFAESVEAAKSSMPPKAEPDQIFTCLDCGSELVQPIEWQEAGPANWTVLLHCPNCDIYREGVFSQACVEAFDEVLDDGADALSATTSASCAPTWRARSRSSWRPSRPTRSCRKTSSPSANVPE